MLFLKDLKNIIFTRHEIFDVDELVILSGYLGPQPVEELCILPLKSKVIYGMFGFDGIGVKLHEALKPLDRGNTSIYYSNLTVHSKCYVWRKLGEIVHALVGSANFSLNGLSNPYREMLAETTRDTFEPLNEYLDLVIENSIQCSNYIKASEADSTNIIDTKVKSAQFCEMTLLDPRRNDVPNASGINWGHGRSHTNRNDAYIAIRREHIEQYPKLFPPKQKNPTIPHGGRERRQNDVIEIIWDDGTRMEGLMEGTQEINGVKFPKQISSSPQKNALGSYLRNRLNVNSEEKVTLKKLQLYGKDSIRVSLEAEGIYYFDFSA